MPQVDIEGIGLLDFPDDATDEEILAFANSRATPEAEPAPSIQPRIKQPSEFAFQSTTRGGEPLHLPDTFALTPLAEATGQVMDAPPLTEALPESLQDKIRSGLANIAQSASRPINLLAPGLAPTLAALPESVQSKVPGATPLLSKESAQGVGSGLYDLASGFTTPIGIGLLGMGGLPKVAQRAISFAFAAQMLSGMPEVATELRAELRKPEGQRDERKIAELITTGMGTTAFSALALKHGLSPTPKGVPNASQVSEATAVHGDVRPQPIQGPREVPVEVSGERVLPRAEEAAEAGRQGVLLSPEETAYLEAERASIEAPVEVAGAIPSDQPFAGQIATIDRSTGKVLINPTEFSAWLKSVPENRRALAVRSLLSEEQLHLKVNDQQAGAYWDSLTAAEKAINRRRYSGKWSGRGISDLNMGHEALRFRLQQLARMTPREIAEAGLKNRIGLQGLTALETTVRTLRETLGTQASQDQTDILDRIQANLTAVKFAQSGTSPSAFRKTLEENPDERIAALGAMSGEAFMNDVKNAEGGLTGDAYRLGLSLKTPEQLDALVKAREEAHAMVKPARDAKDITAALQAAQRGQYYREAYEAATGTGSAGFYFKNNDPNYKAPFPKEEPAAFRKGRKETSEQAMMFLPPPTEKVARPSAVEAGAKLPTGTDISNAIEKHLTGKEAPSFDKFVKGFGGDMQPGQLRDAWEDSVWKTVMNASGEQLGKLRETLKLERNVGSKEIADPTFKPTTPEEVEKLRADIAQRLADQKAGKLTVAAELPRGMEKTRAANDRAREEKKAANARQNYRKTVQSAVARKLIEQSYQGESLKKALGRQTLDVDDLAHSKPGFFREISADEAANPDALTRLVTEDFRGRQAGETLPESNTRRVVALVDKSSGEVRLVSAYKTSNEAWVVDPRAPSKARPNVKLASLLKQYRPLATALLDEPIRNFHQKYESVAEFNDRFADDARAALEAQAAYEPTLGEGAGILERTEEAPSVMEPGGIVTDADAGAILDHLHDTESLKEGTPEEVRSAVEYLSNLEKKGIRYWRLATAYQKIFESVRNRNPELTPEQALQKTYEEIGLKAKAAPDRAAFQRDIIQSFGRESSRDVRGGEATPATPTTGRELRALDRPAIEPYPVPKIGRGQHRPFPFERGGERPLAFNKARAATEDELNRIKGGLTAYAQRRETIQDMARLRDKADNTANIFGDQVERDVHKQSASKTQRQGNPQVLSAAKAMVQSGFRPAALRSFVNLADHAILDAENKIATGNAKVRRIQRPRLEAAKRLKADAEYAQAHFQDPELQQTSQAIHDELELQHAREVASGSTLAHETDYLPGRYEAEVFNDDSVIFGERADVLGRQWRAPKTFKNYWEAIAAGPYVPATYDAASLVGHRVRQGMRQINKKLWVESLLTIPDPHTGNPAVENATPRPDGSFAPANAESVVVHIPGQKPLSVRKGLASTVRNLGGVSNIEDWPGLKTAVRTAQALKHTILLGDFFHLGRLTYYGGAIMGRKFGYKGGATFLEYRPADLPEAVRKGLVDPEDAAWASAPVSVRSGNQNIAMTRGDIARAAINQGLNVGKIQDALYKDMVKGVPVLGRYNRWLFDRFTRGLMLESAVREFERLNEKYPNIEARKLMRDITRDTNNFFGNIGRQGWFKNPTMQALTRIIFLAPQWVEGLVMKEAALPGRLTGISHALGRRGLPVLGTTGRGIARGLTGMLLLTQAVNIITRGKPTWENEEEGHSMDAWIPGKGDSPGAWISPLSIFNELSHDLVRYFETKPTGWEAVRQIGENKLGPYGRLGLVLATSLSGEGKKITTSAGIAKEAAKSLAPVPISFGRLAQAAGSVVAPGLVPPPAPGSVQRQLIGSLGIKSEPAAGPGKRISRLANEFVEKEGLKKETGFDMVPTDEPSYSALRDALASGNTGGAAKVYRSLLQTRKPADVKKAMQLWKQRPFTGSNTHEKLFLRSLTEEERDAYRKAVLDRQKLYEEFIQFYLSQ